MSGTEPNLDREIKVRHLLLGMLGAVVVGVLVVTGIGRLAGFSDVRGALEGADFRWLVVCAVGQATVFAGYATALNRAIRSEGGPRLPAGLSVRLVFASFAATQVLAFGGAGGLAITYWALRRLGLGRDAAAVRMIGLQTAVYLVFGAVGFSAAVWVLVTGEAPLGMTVPWIAGFAVAVVAARWFTAERRVRRWTEHAERWWRRALATGVGAAWWVRRSLAQRAGRPMFAGIALYWAGDIASLWAALRAFGARPALGVIVIAYVTGRLVQSLPIPLIATGGVDAATTFLLHGLGVPLEVALVSVVAHRIFAFWLPVVPGSAFALLLPRTGRALAAHAVAPPSHS